jgi:hypothetical protein
VSFRNNRPAPLPPAKLAGGKDGPSAATPAMRGVAIVLSALHLLVLSMHVWAHEIVDVYPGPAGNLFSIVVMILAPIVAIVLLIRRRDLAGIRLLGAALIGSLAFATPQHFLIHGPDHVTSMAPGPAQELFLATSVVLAVVDLICLVGAALLLCSIARQAR